MKLSRRISGLLIAGVLALPAAAHATLFTITIDGVDPLAPTLPGFVLPGALQPGVFVGLGNCTAPDAPLVGCTGTAENNTLANVADVLQHNIDLFGPVPTPQWFTPAVIYGYNRPLDQVIFHGFSTTFDVTGNVISGLSGVLSQTFDYIVGSTGAGTAGPQQPNVCDGFNDYSVSLARNVHVTGPGGTLSQLANQTGTLRIGWCEDTLTILASGPVSFDLAQISGENATVSVALGPDGPITQGDPEVDVLIVANAVPVPSTIALLGLGLLGLFARRIRTAT